ncbi:iron complex transport system permease protein [Herminiimonas fonticola]|uniref:Iron complex transport system permease protein n=2 Tax=Herminiimonas fonticola TaxID=303380 RepID=A0A4V3BVA1_9BURK|nr:ABC-type Fe3+-siderophore transport system permease component [Herminiimonas fonticola]TDN89868.1 iron complex transport system permease protein [Herminiimonas fonticola]
MAHRAISTPRPQGRKRAWMVLSTLVFLALLSVLIACVVGSVALPVQDVLSAMRELTQGTNSTMAATLVDLRLSRALSAFVTGATLALAGVMMQALLRNPLAEPYVLGVSGGAAVGALSAMLLFSMTWSIDVAAFGGAMAVSVMLYLLAQRDLRGSVNSDGGAPLLLLTGVILASGCSALVALMLSIAPDNRLRGMVFWMIGDLSGTQFRWLPWIVLIGALIFSTRAARAINVIALHAEAAVTLGINVAKFRIGLFLCAALLTASAVSNAGSIGFVGLIVPHACRFVLGPDHRLLLPAAALVGGAFLVLADTLARSVVAPQQLPVGVITAIIGVPVFLLQLHQLRKR